MLMMQRQAACSSLGRSHGRAAAADDCAGMPRCTSTCADGQDALRLQYLLAHAAADITSGTGWVHEMLPLYLLQPGTPGIFTSLVDRLCQPTLEGSHGMLEMMCSGTPSASAQCTCPYAIWLARMRSGEKAGRELLARGSVCVQASMLEFMMSEISWRSATMSAREVGSMPL
jgi:hypothetical protein